MRCELRDNLFFIAFLFLGPLDIQVLSFHASWIFALLYHFRFVVSRCFIITFDVVNNVMIIRHG